MGRVEELEGENDEERLRREGWQRKLNEERERREK